MNFMSCILLRCKWPIGHFACNKLIDWLIDRLICCRSQRQFLSNNQQSRRLCIAGADPENELGGANSGGLGDGFSQLKGYLDVLWKDVKR